MNSPKPKTLLLLVLLAVAFSAGVILFPMAQSSEVMAMGFFLGGLILFRLMGFFE